MAAFFRAALYALFMSALVIIGGGNMGGAIVRGMITRGVLPPEKITVIEIDRARHAAFHEHGCAVTDKIDAGMATLADGGQAMLAVKPQVFADVAAALAPVKRPRLFISIMAGLGSGRIHHALGPAARIVRCMPNVGCQIGAGMTAIALGMGAREGDEDLARQIFDALGKTVMVDESHMHAVTAVSGSGPAYVFLLAEAMERAARAIDLPEDVARLLVKQTILGASRMLDEAGREPSQLRESVTSPGGTTAAALHVFARAGLERLVIDAIRAARDRGVELNLG
jgi:pyrroline-5-carboxylate reductase